MVMTRTHAPDAEALAAAGRLLSWCVGGVTPGPAALAASGLLGLTVPARFGGPQCSVTTLAEVHRLLAASAPHLALLLHGHSLFLRALAEQGSPEQQRRLFAEALTGTCFAGVGAGFGGRADHTAWPDHTARAGAPGPAGPMPLTLCRRRNGVYRLDGESPCAAGVPQAGRLVVRAVLVDELAEETDEPDEVLAVIGRDDLGVSSTAPSTAPSTALAMASSRVSPASEEDGGVLRFDGVRVAAADVVPYSTLFDRPTTFGARERATRAALDPHLPPDDLRELALAVDLAEPPPREDLVGRT
ncbi:acyl-CoA dehydrogenase family protein [Kineosporia sp. J2-2]|uniref:Acyl-CoA dehydrogenase family protein n=1 Tax=Kineosporia corallincola TaxID=2835133 RepID=A0ABS5TTF3_9ACTN|nr:acyl-CoA dehydrogenase family protein [Kineosporia corallincola]MBT0774068.1 acyl-CoA dehydrogenase family protein [Kineosporia corallincola]